MSQPFGDTRMWSSPEHGLSYCRPVSRRLDRAPRSALSFEGWRDYSTLSPALPHRSLSDQNRGVGTLNPHGDPSAAGGRDGSAERSHDREGIARHQNQGTTESASSGEPWAVVLGISAHADSRLDLASAAKDATEFQKLMPSPLGGGFEPENVEFLLDGDGSEAGSGDRPSLAIRLLPRVSGHRTYDESPIRGWRPLPPETCGRSHRTKSNARQIGPSRNDTRNRTLRR